MSWEIFRCDTDCASDPNNCIGEKLYEQQTDALVAGGYLAAGYNGIHIDGEARTRTLGGREGARVGVPWHSLACCARCADCWERTNPPRDPNTNELVPDPTRFPSGFKALGDYMHGKGVKFAIYTAESTSTCGGYPASKGYEAIDAQTFAGWGVDYVRAAAVHIA